MFKKTKQFFTKNPMFLTFFVPLHTYLSVRFCEIMNIKLKTPHSVMFVQKTKTVHPGNTTQQPQHMTPNYHRLSPAK